MPTRRPRGRPRHPDVLTPTEWDVLDAIRHGMSRREIARRRAISVSAVRYHVSNISGKLGVGGVPDLRLWPGVPTTSPLSAARKEPSTMTTSPALAFQGLGQVSLFIRDVERAERFYGETLGLPHVFTFGDLAFFDLGGTRLYLHRKDDADWGPGSILYLVVADIHAAYEELGRRGVERTGAPHRIHVDEGTGTEEWMAFFLDGEGNTLALMSRVAHAV